jgi:enoyl-CoA hydratase
MAIETGSEKILFEKQKHVGIITLSNGDFNVFDPEQIIALRDLLKALEWNNSIHTVVIQGSGDRAFSSGFDLKHFDMGVILSEGREIVYRLYELPKPTISLVHGYALGVGFLIAMACDFHYATKSSSFQLPEINYDIMPHSHGCCTIVSKLVRKPSDLKYILYTGNRFPTSKADQMGLIDEIFETKEEMIDAGLEFAHTLSKKNPVVLAATKTVLKRTQFADVRPSMDIEIEPLAFIDRPPEMNKQAQQAALREFLEKYRTPF